jgi:hypothetical protein
MRRALFIMLFSICSCSSCATVHAPEVIEIMAHEQYASLNGDEQDVIEDILDKALESNRKEYYFKKLILLLDTTTNPLAVTRKLNNERIQRSVEESKRERREIAQKGKKDLEEYMNEEELYEQRENLKWKGYRPYPDGSYFYVSHNSFIDILVHIRVRVHGNSRLVEKILSLEDAVEKHLRIPGFSVNLVFVGNERNDVFEVNVDPSRWAGSHNWSGGYKTLAHELMHLMGLPDEYDRIESHAGNKNMSRIQRLLHFRAQMDNEVPADARYGIMCYSSYKPLERHVCAAVGLGADCVQHRMEEFHLEE